MSLTLLLNVSQTVHVCWCRVCMYEAVFIVYVCLHPFLGAGPMCRHAWAPCVCAGGESLVSHVFAHEMRVCAG